MKVLTGYLTQTNKVAIKAILDANLESGKVGKINYFLSCNDGIYTVVYQKKDRGMGFIGEPLRLSTYKATFQL